jgi:hypothetical protein
MSLEQARKVCSQPHSVDHSVKPLRAPWKIDLKPIAQSMLARIEQLFDSVIVVFIEDLTQKSELKLWQKLDRQGCVHWYAHDRLTGKSMSFASEEELLRWIDNRNHLDRW